VILDQAGGIESTANLTTVVTKVAAGTSAARFGVSASNALVGISFGLSPNPFSAFALQGGNFQGQNAPERIYVDNRNGPSDVLVKPEDDNHPPCQEDIFFLGRTVYRGRIDGVKPPAWEWPGDGLATQDWYKVSNGFGVQIDSSGAPHVTFPDFSLFESWRELIPDCNFDQLCYQTPLYLHAPGRKREPEWSAPPPIGWTAEWRWHGDWRYPTPYVPQYFSTRTEACQHDFRVP